MTLVVVALVATAGLSAALWGARGPRTGLRNLAFYLGAVVGLWAALGFILLVVIEAIMLGLNP